MTVYNAEHARALLCWPLNMYINSSIIHSIKKPNIHQPKNTDVVITTPGALGW